MAIVEETTRRSNEPGISKTKKPSLPDVEGRLFFCSPLPPQIRTFSLPLWVGLRCPTIKDHLAFIFGEDKPRFGEYEIFLVQGLLPIQHQILKAREWQQLIEAGEVTRADIARQEETSRARVTQILNLLKLSGEVQGFILGLEPLKVGERGLTERRLRPLLKLSSEEQMREISSMVEQAYDGENLRIQRYIRSNNSDSI